MTTLLAQQIGNVEGWLQPVVMALAVAAAIFERLRNMSLLRSVNVSTAKDELLKVVVADRDAWKARYETEHGEYVARRQQYHDEADKINTRILTLTEENAQLRIKTDITPVLHELKAQSEINVRVLDSLTTLTVEFKRHQEAHHNGGHA